MSRRFYGQQRAKGYTDDGERQWYKEKALNAWDIKCSACNKIFGYWDDESAACNHTSQDHAIFFCSRCRQLAEKEK